MEVTKYSIRDLLAAVGVILTLVFVGLEIRQNTNAIEAAAIQKFSTSFRAHVALYINDPDMTRIIRVAVQDLEKLAPVEAQRFLGWALSGALMSQGAFRQWQMGVLPDEEWSVVLKTACNDSKNLPSYEAIIEGLRPYLIPSYLEAIDNACNDESSP